MVLRNQKDIVLHLINTLYVRVDAGAGPRTGIQGGQHKAVPTLIQRLFQPLNIHNVVQNTHELTVNPLAV